MDNIQNIITNNLDIWSSALDEKKTGRGRGGANKGSIYGVKKLRELILDLAVRGKLVPQDPNDEPASELLKRIAKEKQGKLKKEKPLAPISDDEKPFDLPNGWCFTKLAELGEFGRGKSKHRPRNEPKLFQNGIYPLVQTGEVSRADWVINEYHSKYSDFGLAQSKMWPKNTLCITIAANIADAAILGFDACFPDSVVGLVCNEENVKIDYIMYFMKTARSDLIKFAPATAQKNINLEILSQINVPIPPLNEQVQIVAKVDELMALCDALEAGFIKSSDIHDELVSTLLNAITNSQDHQSFLQNWQIINDNFATLFSAPESIEKLKQSILQLAIMGKLVPQDPNDEPASELLKRIQSEKQTLIAEGKLKKEKPLPPITKEEKPFDLPTGWEWIRLGVLLTKIGAGSTPLGGKQVYLNEGIPFLRSQNVWDDGLNLEDVAFISKETHDKMSGTHVRGNDLLFNITGGSIGRCAIVPPDFIAGNVSQHVTIIRLLQSGLLPFIHNVLISEYVQKTVMDVQVGVSREGLSISKLSQFLVPIPPIDEQHRIVAKVDELMALCDELKSKITLANQTKITLANTLSPNNGV